MNFSAAEVQITLRNRGTDAFKSDMYGKSITVCRKLCDGGGGGYKILSADGKFDQLTFIRKYTNSKFASFPTVDTKRVLLAVSGKIISQKKEELDHILDQFNIQVDNPVAILNQDTSRNFLHSKNATDKYMVCLNQHIYKIPRNVSLLYTKGTHKLTLYFFNSFSSKPHSWNK